MSAGSAPPALSRETIVDFIVTVFKERGREEYLGEPVTMAEHMLQSAHFAAEAGEDEEIVVAALLHDIGHFTGAHGMFSMADTEDRHHEDAGAAVLSAFFPDVVTDCVRHHVAAKRYLCAVDPAYFDGLSEASVHSLKLQGGPMVEAEIAEFESNEHHQAITRVRRYDDAGKIAGLKTRSIEEYRDKIQRVIDRHCKAP